MEWAQVLTVFAVVVAYFTTIIILYLHLDNKTDKTISSMREDTKQFHNDIMMEMRDFHGRLIAIEERARIK